MKAERRQLSYIFGLLKEIEWTDKAIREEIVADITQGRSISCSDLTWEEAEIMCDFLQNKAVEFRKAKHTPPPVATDTADRQRKAIISKFREMGYNRYDESRNMMVADMPRIYAYVQEKWHKRLNDFTSAELARILAVLNTKFIPNFYKKQN